MQDRIDANRHGAGARFPDAVGTFGHGGHQAAKQDAGRAGRRQAPLGSKERLHEVAEACTGDARPTRQAPAAVLDRRGGGAAIGRADGRRRGVGADQNSDAGAGVNSRAVGYEIGTENRPESISEICPKIRLRNCPKGTGAIGAGDVGIRAVELRLDVAPAIDGALISPVVDYFATDIGHDRDRPGKAFAERHPGDAADDAGPVRRTEFCRRICAAAFAHGAIFSGGWAAEVDSGASKAAVDPYRARGEISSRSARRILPDVGAVRLSARENVSSGKSSDKNRRRAASLRTIVANRARDLDRRAFTRVFGCATLAAIEDNAAAFICPACGFMRRTEAVGASGSVSASRGDIGPIFRGPRAVSQILSRGNCHRNLSRKFGGRSSIRGAEPFGISSLGTGNQWPPPHNYVPNAEFSNFYHPAAVGGKSRALGAVFANIRMAKHFGISSLNAKSHYAAGVCLPISQIDFFEALKLRDFFEWYLGLQKHIRIEELFSTSGLFLKSRCAAIIFAGFCQRAIFGALKHRPFFARCGASEKHIRRGEVFDTSCPNAQRARFAGPRSVPDQDDRKFFIFSEFSDTLVDGFAASKDIRRAKLVDTFCPGVPRQFSGESACDDSSAGAISAVNSGECLTEINVQKLPDFSKVISRAPSSESITGINAAISPDLVIPHLSESIRGISAHASPEAARINSGEVFTEINARVCDSPFEQTRLADSSIRAFPVRADSMRACACLKARAPP